MMWVTLGLFTGVIKQLCGWTGKAKLLPKLQHRAVLWFYRICLEKSSSAELNPQGVPSLSWQHISNADSLHPPQEIIWVLAFRKLKFLMKFVKIVGL